MTSAKDLLELAKQLNDKQDYKGVIQLLSDNDLKIHNSAQLYLERAYANWGLTNYGPMNTDADMALMIEPNNKKGLCYKGIYHRTIQDYKKAKHYLIEAIQIDPKYAEAHNSLGVVYTYDKDPKRAIECYEEATKIAPHYANAYENLGYVYLKLREWGKARENFARAIEINSNYLYCYFNLGECFFKLKLYNDALKAYTSFVVRSDDKNDNFSSIAKFNIDRLEKITDKDNEYKGKDSEYKKFFESVTKVKDLLEFRENCITHFTSLSAAKALILDDSKFRLSEGAFLNDTSEGQQLFKYLEFPVIIQTGKDIVAQPFSRKPFIGSFVSEAKHDDLTLWRMYGKEEKDEAKGCAITLAREVFLESLSDKLMSNSSLNSSTSEQPSNPIGELEFYQVAYRSIEQKDKFIIPGSKESEPALNKAMKALKSQVDNFKKPPQKKEIETQNVMELLNEISFLFKSAEYQHEHEVRLIINGTGFKKEINKTPLPLSPPRVYIELVSIRPLIRKITLGPKIDRSDEWAASFYYNLHADSHYPRILISKKPFK